MDDTGTLSRRSLLAGLAAGALVVAGGASPATASAHRRARRALIIVDVQVDFCEGGSLGVAGGTAVARGVSRLLARHRRLYDCVAATLDWHIDPGSHFSATPDYVNSWPVHCVAGTHGAQLHPDLSSAVDITTVVDVVIHKGQYSGAYSGFEGASLRGRPLAEELRRRRIGRLDVVGIATDFCVRATVLDGLRLGFDVRVLTPLCAGVTPEGSKAALGEMARAGAKLSHAHEH